MSDPKRNFSPRIGVLIPTRNRADLAIAAIRSVLDEPVDNIQLIVSDNSSVEDQKARLRGFCELFHSNVRYISPPTPLSMSQHWDWAMQQSIRTADIDHFIYLTDRSIFKAGALSTIEKIVRTYPEEVISYDWTTVFDHSIPIVILEQQHTGQILKLDATKLLALSAQAVFPRSLPRMMTCCVPVSVLEEIKQTFGTVFSSISPDYNFCYRCLKTVNRIVFYDQAVFVSYALARSTGMGITRKATDASIDFEGQLDLNGRPQRFATPVPSFETVTNYILHEYCVVKAETGSPEFPEISRRAYLARNARDIMSLEDKDLKRRMEEILKTQEGYSLAYNLKLLQLRVKLALRARAKKVLNLQWPSKSKPPLFDSLPEAMNYAQRFRTNGDLPKTI